MRILSVQIELVKTLGTTAAGPEVFVMIPPPLMAARAYGMNETVKPLTACDSVFFVCLQQASTRLANPLTTRLQAPHRLCATLWGIPHGLSLQVINTVFPTLVPEIASAGKLRGAIDIFNLFGGSDSRDFPPGGCTLQTLDKAKCGYYCSASQSWQCDQCHPDDAGYAAMAEKVAYVVGDAVARAKEATAA